MYDKAELKPLPKTIFDEIKLRLRGPIPEGGTVPATLRVSVINNNPRLDVFTNLPSNNQIMAPMDGPAAFSMLSALSEIIDGPEDSQIKIDNLAGSPGRQEYVSTTVIGKDKEGRVYISVIAENRPRIKFVFLPSAWHVFCERDGTPVDEARLSRISAKGWIRMVTQLLGNVMADNYSPSPRYQAYVDSKEQHSGDAGEIIEQSKAIDESDIPL